MLEDLKHEVCRANLELERHGLVIRTWGNASGRDPESGMVVIKPSGVSYDSMGPEDMVIVDPDGKVIEGRFRPSTETPTHLFLYRVYPGIGGIVHTHSTFATSWAQACRSIPALGTTHADHFHGDVPCSRPLQPEEIDCDYELNTGRLIAETLGSSDPLDMPAVLVCNHGPFCWGTTPEEAVHNAVALEEIARMAFNTVLLGNSAPVSRQLLDRHFRRKHGSGAYYGQKGGS